MVEDEDGEEDGEEAVTDSEEEASKKRAQRKAKRDAARARSLLLVGVPGLSAPASASVPVPGSSAPASASVPVPGLSAAVPGSSAPASASVPVPGSSAAVPESSAAVPGSSVAVPESSAAVPGSSAPASASVPVPGSSAPVPPSAPMLPGSSPLPFPALSLPKTPTPDLAAGRQRLDDTISGWSGRSKRVSSEELCSGRIKKAALEEAFLLRAPLFLPLFPSSGIAESKFDKTFINTRLLADNHAEREVDFSFAVCGCSLVVKLNKLWQIDFLERRPARIVGIIPLVAAIFWDPNFVPCPCHTLNLATKLGFKTKNLRSALVKERIQSIWANRTIGQLDALFKENLDWWSAIAVIYSQPLVKNGK